MDNFLPSGYEVPEKTGSYFKFQDGDNRLRILASPIIGWETWQDTPDGGRKPLRNPMNKAFTTAEADGPDQIKHFWAMPVWNYQEEKVQILEITQKGLQKSLKSLAKDEDWGSPLNYDIVINKTGKQMETRYSLQPKPAKPLEKKIADAYKNTTIHLEALFEGKDPFEKQETL